MHITYKKALTLVCLQVSLTFSMQALEARPYNPVSPQEQEDEDDDGEDYDYSSSNTNQGLNGSRFESSFGNSGSRSIDYSSGRRYQEREFWSERNKPAQNFDQYYNQNDASNRPSQNFQQGGGSVVIGGGSQPGMQGGGQQAPGQVNVPSIKDPFQTNPGIKAPRNIDAVPDNNGDPNDVPVDGGVLVLGATAIWLGRKKLMNKD
ncbi:MAG: hypothetical protein LCH37_05825 [Bacteroidetes bacterium]|nr:hypothetical protein [Bacteroidota bacterium]